MIDRVCTSSGKNKQRPTMSSRPTPSPHGPEYHHALRSAPNTPVRALLAIATFIGAATASLIYVLPLANTLDDLLPFREPPLTPHSPPLTPGLLIASNALTAIQIPVAMLIEKVLYKQPPTSICSTETSFRRRWFLALARRVLPVVAIFGTVIHLVNQTGWPRISHRTLMMGIAVLGTTPLQSAAEEFAVRGLLQRVIAACFSDPATAFWASTAITSTFFAVIHVSTDKWTNMYYLLSGICGSLMTRWTGGLEAGVLVHAGNNLALMLPVSLADNKGFLEELLGGKGIGGWTVSMAVVNLGVVTLLVRRMVLNGRGSESRYPKLLN